MAAVVMVTGCASSGGTPVSYSDLLAEGQGLYTQSDAENYQPAIVGQIELLRMAVNTAFLAGKPAYEEYVNQLKNETILGNYFAAVEAVEDESNKRAIYDALSVEDRKIVDDFTSSAMSKKILSNLGEAALVATQNIAKFQEMDATSLLSNIDFSQMMAEKNKLTFTVDQIDYLSDTVISAYNNYKIVSAFRSAQ